MTKDRCNHLIGALGCVDHLKLQLILGVLLQNISKGLRLLRLRLGKREVEADDSVNARPGLAVDDADKAR